MKNKSTNCINKNSTRNLLSLLNSLTYKECTWPFLQPVSPIDYFTYDFKNIDNPSSKSMSACKYTLKEIHTFLLKPPQNVAIMV